MSKANPIKDTITKVPRLPDHAVIYQIPASPYWWTRCYAPSKRYVVRSTKTTDKREAFKFATQVFYETETNAVSGTNLAPQLFRSVALSLLEREKATSKRTLYVNDESKLNGLIFQHFGSQSLNEITYQDMTSFMVLLRTKMLAPATKKHYLSLVKKVFSHGVELQVIDRVPLFPKIGEKLQTAKKRDYLTFGEYTKLSKTILTMEKAGSIYRGTPITLEFKLLVNFMINSFIRPSDLRVIKHMHVVRRVDSVRNVTWLTLRHPATKTTANDVQTMPSAVEHYDDLKVFRQEQYKKRQCDDTYLKPDDYLFLPAFKNRSTAMEKLGKIFAFIIKESRLKETTGKNLTLYSLRHTAIMYRLMKSDVDSLGLAKNARTSQAVIEKFYGSHLTTEQARVKLHSFTDSNEPRKHLSKR